MNNPVTTSELLARLRRIQDVRKFGMEPWGLAAGLSRRAVAMLYERMENGGSAQVASVQALAAVAGVPLWTLFHPDGFLLEQFLSEQNPTQEEVELSAGNDLILQVLKNISKTSIHQTEMLQTNQAIIREHVSVAREVVAKLDTIACQNTRIIELLSRAGARPEPENGVRLLPPPRRKA